MANALDVSDAVAFDWMLRDQRVIEGLDQLGIQVVSINIYASLLPGITNVTDRARYYSFYPWVLHRYAQRGSSQSSRAEWRTWLRRLDYAYALASAAHEAKTHEPATAVVGVDRARRELKSRSRNASVDLVAATALDSKGKARPAAYFKNPEGGLGQYYKGALDLLGVVIEDSAHRFPDRVLTEYAGLPVATSVDLDEAFQSLLEIASRGRGSWVELEEIGRRVHPGAIQAGSDEQTLLRHLLLGTDESLRRGEVDETLAWRRASLRLMLAYTRACQTVPGDLSTEFRWAVMERSLPSGAAWEVSLGLEHAAVAWAGYQRNDLMNYALESLFWVALGRIDEEEVGPSQVADDLAHVAVEGLKDLIKGVGRLAKAPTVADLLAVCGAHDPRSTDGTNQASTRAWVDALDGALEQEDMKAVSGGALRILGRIAADGRADQDRPFGDAPASQEVLAAYEVHLGSWLRRCQVRLREDLHSFLAELILEWILYRHLRVATRKLAGQGVSTFKFRPEEGRLLLTVDELTQPVFTSPRLKAATRILADLGYLRSDDQGTHVTEDGSAASEAADD